MYVSVTRVHSAEEPIENATLVAEEMERWLRDIDGYHGFLMLSEAGTTLGLTFWDSRAVAEAHRASRLQFIERMTAAAGVEVEAIDGYEVAYASDWLSPG